MLLRAEWFFHILTEGRIKSSLELPILQTLVFGWIVAGCHNS